MARRPNYSFERNERAKAKAAKKAAKREAKAALKEAKQAEFGGSPEDNSDDSEE
ncbi:MAG: hypothetical protein V3R73_07715 [Sphingomonadales bacterium]